jgi:hypothetical protein
MVWYGCVEIKIRDQVRVGKVKQAMCCGRRNSRLLVSRYIGYISPRIYSQRLPSCSTRNPSQGNLPSEAAQHTDASPPPPSLSSPPHRSPYPLLLPPPQPAHPAPPNSPHLQQKTQSSNPTSSTPDAALARSAPTDAARDRLAVTEARKCRESGVPCRRLDGCDKARGDTRGMCRCGGLGTRAR